MPAARLGGVNVGCFRLRFGLPFRYPYLPAQCALAGHGHRDLVVSDQLA